MTDLALISAELERIAADLAATMSKLRVIAGDEPSVLQTAPAVAAPVAKSQPKYMPAASAFNKRYPLNTWVVRRICSNHGDWAKKLAGTWHVDLDRFNEFADKVDRGEAQFVSSEKFTSSLANNPSLEEHASNSIGDDAERETTSDQNREAAGAGSQRS